MAKKTSEVEIVTKSVELLAKTLILVTGACYVLGLVVVNIHLSRYGFYSLSLLQLNYVTAGIWTLLPVLLAVIVSSLALSGRKNFLLSDVSEADLQPGPSRFGADDKTQYQDAADHVRKFDDDAADAHKLKDDGDKAQVNAKTVETEAGDRGKSQNKNARKKTRLRRIWRSSNKVLALMLAATGAFIAIRWALGLLGGYLGFTFGPSWLLALVLGGPACFLVLACLIGWVRITKRGPSATLGELSNAVVATGVAIVLFILYIGIFARGPYKEIPSGLGGGRPEEVSFIVDAASKPYLEAEKLLRFTGDSTRSEPVDLILATDKEYVFVSAGTTVSIPNGSVKAVLHEKK